MYVRARVGTCMCGAHASTEVSIWSPGPQVPISIYSYVRTVTPAGRRQRTCTCLFKTRARARGDRDLEIHLEPLRPGATLNILIDRSIHSYK